MKKKKFLVFRDLDTSGYWLYLYARSKEDIERRFPEFYLFDVPPKSFDAAKAQLIEKHPDLFIFDIDNLHGLLKDYVENEQKDDYIYQNPDKKRPFVDDI